MNPQWHELAADVPWIAVASALRLVICLRLTAQVPWDKYLLDPALLVPNLRVILMSVLVQPVSDLRELLQIVLARDDPVAMATAVVLVRTHRGGAPVLELPSVLSFLEGLWREYTAWVVWRAPLSWPELGRPLPSDIPVVPLYEAFRCRSTGGWSPWWQDQPLADDQVMSYYHANSPASSLSQGCFFEDIL